MKTVEEKAERYANEMYQDANEWDACYDGYVTGYNEAMRWRDPKVELPDYYQKVDIKFERDGVVDYVSAALLVDDDGSYFFGDYNFDIFIKFKYIIGWRPIE